MSRRSRRDLAGSYGKISIFADMSMASKSTDLFGKLGDDDDRYLMSCNVREMVIMKQFQSSPLEGVIRCYGVNVTNASKLVANMQMASANLFEFVKRYPFDERMALFDAIFKQVTIGVVNMHRNGLLHGDIKPNNIVLVSMNPLEVKLVDFGGSSWMNRPFKQTSLCTYVTRCPSLFEPDSTPSYKADAYSLGATMLYFVTKTWAVDDCPPDGVDAMEYMREQMKDLDIWIPPALPKRLRVMLAGLLDFNPETRWSVQDAARKYFGFFDTGIPRPRRPAIPKLPAVKDKRRFTDIIRRIYAMVSAMNETVVAPYVINYVQRYFQNDFDKPTDDQIHDAMAAAFALARAIVLDNDTPVSEMSDAVQSTIIAMLRRLDFDLVNPQRNVPNIISIDGNIAASKSTVIAALNAAGIPAVPEPVEEWAPLLKLFYEDQSRWATALHVKILSAYAEMFRKHAATGTVLVCERSPWSCLHVFQSMLRADDVVGQEEHEAVMKLGIELGCMPDVVIYLRTEPDVCVERQVKRRRLCEEGLSSEYIGRLHSQYEKVMDEAHCHRYGITLVTVDANRLPEEVCADVIDKVRSFL